MRSELANKRKVAKATLSKNPPETQIDILADYIYNAAVHDGSALLDAFNYMRDVFLIDALKREFSELPHSPLSKELRRTLRRLCREKAQKVAKEILVAEDSSY